MNQGRRDPKRGDSPARGLQFGVANYAAFVLGLTSIAAGYVLLDRGSVTAAPLMLMVGYVVFLPAGLILGWRRLQ